MKKSALYAILILAILILAAIGWAKTKEFQKQKAPAQAASTEVKIQVSAKVPETSPVKQQEVIQKNTPKEEPNKLKEKPQETIPPAPAKTGCEEESKSLESIEFLTGFGWGPLHGQKGYRTIPFAVSFDFDLKPLLRKINLSPRPLVQFQIEPFISPIIGPKANLEMGTAFFFKIGFLPQSAKFQPYAKIGVGLDYMTLHTREQSTQFNFIDLVGAGFHYFFRKNMAFTFEYRYRHLSNAGMSSPNHGINSHFALTGINYQF